MKRLAVYSFFDKDGIVDKYVTFFLQDLKKNCEEIIVVCNGKLTVDGKKELLQTASRVIVRDNFGFDIWGYKTGLDTYGWDTLKQCDEVIVANNTMLGPVYPFSDMFLEMETRTLDFWGITRHYGAPYDPWGLCPFGFIPEHIQSNFVVFRKRLVMSIEFQKYWNELPSLETYEAAISKHESYFTKYFFEKGFRWDTYVNTDSFKDLTDYPLMNYPKELIQDFKCPIFKRRTFFQDYDFVVNNTAGQSAVELYSYLSKTKIYDVNMIWENILRTCSLSDLMRNLQLRYILPTEAIINETNDIKNGVFFFFNSTKWLEYFAEIVPRLSLDIDVHVFANDIIIKDKCIKLFAAWPNACFHLCNSKNKVSFLRDEAEPFMSKYKYACFCHNDFAQIEPKSVEESFLYYNIKSVVDSELYVNHVITTFENNPKLGLLVPPLLSFASFYKGIDSWGHEQYLEIKEAANKLGVRIPVVEGKMRIMTEGAFCWFRCSALEGYWRLFRNKKRLDSRFEEGDTDQLYAFLVQNAGFYTATLCSDSIIKITYTNLLYYIQGYNQTLNNYGIKGCQYEMRAELNRRMKEIEYKEQETYNLQERVEYLEKANADLLSQTSLKYQIKKRMFGIRK